MRFYESRILPALIHLSMRQRNFSAYRQRVIPRAAGAVLEIGVGSGLNFPYYTRSVDQIVALDPSAKLLTMAERAASENWPPVELLEGSAESIPLPDNSIDTVVTTWTLCSIPDVSRALREMRRVVKPDGRLLFVEHGRSPDWHVHRWQDRITPLWKKFSGGCHLNRDIGELIEDAGFEIDSLETGYMKGPRPMTFMYEGSAVPDTRTDTAPTPAPVTPLDPPD